jgi:hypothetical protein
MADGNMTVTTGAAFIPEIWSGSTLNFREMRLVITPQVDRTFETDAEFGDTIHVVGVSELSARTKSAGVDLTYEALTESTTDISIDQHKYAAVLIEDILKIQSKYDLREKYTSQFGYVLAKVVDNQLGSMFGSLSQTVGTLAVASTDADVRRALQYLDDADAPDESRCFIISNAEASAWLAIDKYVNQDYAGIASIKQKYGLIGTVYQVPVYKSNNLQGSNAAGHDCALLHKSCLALVLQMKVRTKSEFSVDADGWKLAAHEVFGKKEMRDSHGVWVKAA